MKSLLILTFLIFTLKTEKDVPILEQDTENIDLENQDEDKEKVPEFIEIVDDQVYLHLLGDKDKYYLDLLNFQESLENGTLDLKEQFGHSCQDDILRAFQLKGMKAPVMKDPNLEQCNKMTYNCCTNEDLLRVQNQLDTLKKNTEYNHQYNILYIREIIKSHKKYKKKIEKIKDESQHQICQQTADLFMSHYVDENTLKEIDEKLIEIQNFDLDFKKGSLCYLCDFHNHKYFDSENSTVFFNVDVCHHIVDKTFETFYYFNKFVWRYINTVNILAHCYKKNKNGVGQFSLDNDHSFDFLKIDNSLYIEDCMFAIENNKKKQKVLVSCLNYCHKFNFFMQGYPIFQDIMLLSKIFKNIINSFLPDYVEDIEYPSFQKGSNYDFDDQSKDVFNNFNRVFSQDGIHINQVMDVFLE